MASVYILYSSTLDHFYVGSCAELSFRLQQHLNKDFIHSFTAKANDWAVFYTIENLSYPQARSIEAHIKKMKSRVYIMNLKKYPEMTEKLVAKTFE